MKCTVALMVLIWWMHCFGFTMTQSSLFGCDWDFWCPSLKIGDAWGGIKVSHRCFIEFKSWINIKFGIWTIIDEVIAVYISNFFVIEYHFLQVKQNFNIFVFLVIWIAQIVRKTLFVTAVQRWWKLVMLFGSYGHFCFCFELLCFVMILVITFDISHHFWPFFDLI